MPIRTTIVRVQLLPPSLPLVYAEGPAQERRQEIPMAVFSKLKRRGAAHGYFRAVWDDVLDVWNIQGESGAKVSW